MSKTVHFQSIQFSISTQFSSIWPIDKALSGTTTQGQSGSESDGNEGVHRIPQSSRITRTSPSDCLMSYPGHLLAGPYPSTEMQSVYSTASPDWPTRWRGLIPLQRCSRCILQLQPTGPLVGEVSPLYRDAVGVFNDSSRLAHSLAGSHLSTKMQSVYSTASPD